METKKQEFKCYICGKHKPAAEQAVPCLYTKRFGLEVCRECCEICRSSEPFSCREYKKGKWQKKTGGTKQ